MAWQRTVKDEISFSGVGLHTGSKTTVTFKPAPADTGIIFVRKDLAGSPSVKADVKNVVSVVRGTNIGGENFQVHTVEHILASLYGLEIDNVIVELSAEEPPVGDGSARLFVETLQKAGVIEQQSARKYFVVKEPVRFSQEGTELIALPYDGFKVNCTINFSHPLLKSQYFFFTQSEKVFIEEIAPSRTFCFDYEIEHLIKKGLAKGGTLDSAVVIGENKIHTDLRFSDEFVRHKILDLIGDLSLVGLPIKGQIIAIRCGHPKNVEFARILSQVKEISSTPSVFSFPAPPPGEILDLEQIKATIPHRDPFLLVDRVVIIEKEKKAVGWKNVRPEENYFRGHFPGRPIMPGVLVIESMAQTACVLFLSRPDLSNKLAYFMGINEAKFRKPVFPGDQVRLEIEVLRARERGGKVRGNAYIGDSLVAEAEFMFVLVDK